MRALRATLVVPGLFAFCYLVVGDLQMATFAAFGGFATLVLASFGPGRRDKVVAHLGLAVAGSLLLVVGTAVNGSWLLATLVTVPVVFLVLFAGIAGPNAAAGGAAALLAYVLPAASPGTFSMVPDRLAGWWLASVVGTVAVLVLSPRPPADRLRAAAADSAAAIAGQLDAALAGRADAAHRDATIGAKTRLLAAFTGTPYRPTSLTTTDQALASLVGLLEWTTSVVCDSLREYRDLTGVAAVERELFAATAGTLRAVAAVLSGKDAQEAPLDVAPLEAALRASVAALRRMPSIDEYAEAVHLSFHARTAGLAAHTTASDALIASRRADQETIADRRRRWYGVAEPALGSRALGGLAELGGVAVRHASLRSVWFVNSIRGAVALAAAVLVADLSGVQHGFWVVLGALSVLRTNAASTGATAWRALAGTVAGFVIGAALLLVIGTGPGALWIALPVAVLFAAYAPGALPFAVGQAAFTVVVSVLFNLLVPAGWQIGVLRIEDVAIGCAVSLVVGVLFWPRGAGAVVADDLADAFREGGRYLSQAVDWALGLRHEEPDASRSVTAGLRLDDALRGFLAEQGAKHIPERELWRLVGGTIRLRLTAHSLAGLPSPDAEPDPVSDALAGQAHRLSSWFEGIATELSRPPRKAPRSPNGSFPPAQPPAGDGPAQPLNPTGDGSARPTRSVLPVWTPPELAAVAATASEPVVACTLWVEQHLQHVQPGLAGLVEPAAAVARQRRAPWWR
jgi:uncharacterized membrane protein YccC